LPQSDARCVRLCEGAFFEAGWHDWFITLAQSAIFPVFEVNACKACLQPSKALQR
jgi:hypothetical protein